MERRAAREIQNVNCNVAFYFTVANSTGKTKIISKDQVVAMAEGSRKQTTVSKETSTEIMETTRTAEQGTTERLKAEVIYAEKKL